MEVCFIEDNGQSPRVVANALCAKRVAVFPAGRLHGECRTLTCGCAFEAFFIHSEVGVLTAAARVCEAPPQSAAAAVGLSEALAMAVCGGLPAVPAPAVRVE